MKLSANRISLIHRVIVLTAILLTLSTDVFGVLHVKGSLERTTVPAEEEELWIKVKQDLLERKGLIWLMNHPDWVQAYLLNNGSDCGVFLWGRDSMVVTELKKSLDMLSRRNETVTVPNAYPIQERDHHGYVSYPVDSRRYRSQMMYRNSIDAEMSQRRLDYVKHLDRSNRYAKLWFISDTRLYDDARCISLFAYISTSQVIFVDSIYDEYLAECRSLGYEPLYDFYSDGYSNILPDRFSEGKETTYPEIKLLYKYVRKNDSTILGMPSPEDVYDIGFEYDHEKMENVSPITIGNNPVSLYKVGRSPLKSFMESDKAKMAGQVALTLSQMIPGGALANPVILILQKTAKLP